MGSIFFGGALGGDSTHRGNEAGPSLVPWVQFEDVGDPPRSALAAYVLLPGKDEEVLILFSLLICMELDLMG